MKKFNINDFVKVKLTDYGKHVYEHHLDDLNLRMGCHLTPYPLQYDENGYCDFQLWHFMNIFGDHIFNGAPVVIEDNNIYMGEKDLQDA